jgi:hypothetical protein
MTQVTLTEYNGIKAVGIETDSVCIFCCPEGEKRLKRIKKDKKRHVYIDSTLFGEDDPNIWDTYDNEIPESEKPEYAFLEMFTTLCWEMTGII